jgi:hypothetical protein
VGNERYDAVAPSLNGVGSEIYGGHSNPPRAPSESPYVRTRRQPLKIAYAFLTLLEFLAAAARAWIAFISVRETLMVSSDQNFYEGVGTIGRSADSRASRAVAWDSSLSANASKVLSTRALLPIAPRRHSDASTLNNSGEYILSTGPLLRLG